VNFLDKDRLADARISAIGEIDGGGIGTLGEKLIHKTLKYYIVSDPSRHEQRISGAVADVISDGRIYEIQTRALSRLVPKLTRFLSEHPVTVVYPLVTEKSIVWLSADSGEAAEPKKSSKKQIAASALYELSAIAALLDDCDLTVELLLVKATEYRLSDGYGSQGHKRATKLNIHLDEITEQISLRSTSDLKKLLPETLPETFTAKELYKAMKLRDRQGYYALKTMEKYGFLRAVEKRGRAVIYTSKNTVQESE
jgi:hypothetical protein